MRMFDNISEFVKDDLKQEIRSGSKVSIAAARRNSARSFHS